MCSAITAQNSKILLTPGTVVSGSILYTQAGLPFKNDIFISNHVFITSEKLPWWAKVLRGDIHFCIIKAISFTEKTIEISIPENYNLVGVVHKDIRNTEITHRSKYCISILTQSALVESDDPIIDEVIKKVYLLNTRIPVLKKIAA